MLDPQNEQTELRNNHQSEQRYDVSLFFQTEGRRFAKGRNTGAPVKTGRVTTLPKPSFKDTTRGDKCTLHMKVH